jgi:chromosome segregation and condensation protein ScpB
MGSSRGRSRTSCACLAAVRVSIAEVRLGLRRLAEQLEPAGMQVLDDGSHVQLAPAKRFHEAVAQLVQPERLPRLTQEQAEVLAVVIMDGMATRRRIEEVRGAASLSIGPEGPVSLPRDSSETLALLVSRGLLSAEGDDHATGRPLVYRPTPRLLQLVRAETLEEVRGTHCVPEAQRGVQEREATRQTRPALLDESMLMQNCDYSMNCEDHDQPI